MLGRPLYRFDRIPSTMTMLAALAHRGSPEGTTVVADFQDAGKGRADRRWFGPPGSALLSSVLLRPRLPVHELTALSILVADAIRCAISDVYELAPGIKWPNDVLIDGRKVSGVLIKTRHHSNGVDAVVGMGINANVDVTELPPTGVSLHEKIGQSVDRDDLLHAVLAELDIRYRELKQGELEEHRWPDIQQHLVMRGEQVVVEDGDRKITGRLECVDPDGALVLHDDQGDIRVVAGDLGRGPKPAFSAQR